MSFKKKKPPHEAWEALQKASLVDEAARVAKLSDAELDAELAGKGLDPIAVRAEGAALAERLGRVHDEPAEDSTWVTAAPPPTSPRRSSRRPVLLLAAALALAAVVGGAVAAGLLNKHNPPQNEWPDAAPSASGAPSASAAPSATSPLAPTPSSNEFRELPPGTEGKPLRKH